MWGATTLIIIVILNHMFQSTHPCGVRQVTKEKRLSSNTFQSTHPCGVRLLSKLLYFWSNSFNPRTRVGCDYIDSTWGLHIKVSIHAPVWGATRLAGLVITFYRVSIHAPVWGATELLKGGHRVARVSIHAPVWGATKMCASVDFQ